MPAAARAPAIDRQLAAATRRLARDHRSGARRPSAAGITMEATFKLYLITDRQPVAARRSLLAITAAALAAAPLQALPWKRPSRFF